MGKCKIIAEIGWNHMGDIRLAKEMICSAKYAGADYVKFQTWSVKDLKSGPWDNDGRREIYEKAELTKEKHVKLKKYCDFVGIKFLTSVFNKKDVQMISDIGCEEIKIPSTEALDFDLLKKCLNSFKNLYISTGGLGIEELASLRKFMRKFSDKSFFLLHCVSLYPCPLEKANLSRIDAMKGGFCRIGFSDHTEGHWAACAAIVKGAQVVEKHFTIDKNLPGRDNKFACLPEDLKVICDFRDAYDKMSKGTETWGRQEGEESVVEYRGRWG